MMRSFLAVLAGFLAVALLVMVGVAAATAAFVPGGLASMRKAPAGVTLSSTYLAANLLVSFVAAVLGGWLTARLAPHVPMGHVMGLAALLIAMSIIGAMGETTQATQPEWYTITIAIAGVVGVLAGGWLHTRVRQPGGTIA